MSIFSEFFRETESIAFQGHPLRKVEIRLKNRRLAAQGADSGSRFKAESQGPVSGPSLKVQTQGPVSRPGLRRGKSARGEAELGIESGDAGRASLE
jgi:hypothetical protein